MHKYIHTHAHDRTHTFFQAYGNNKDTVHRAYQHLYSCCHRAILSRMRLHVVNPIFKQSVAQGLKPCTHDQICIRMQILHICKICVRTQIWPCVRIYSRMQNLHICKSWKICTCLRPSANLILRIRKICVYANLVM